MVASNHSLHLGASSSIIPPIVSAADGDVSDFQALIDAESNSLGGADTDSKDSQNLKEETITKEWFYEDMEVNEIGSEEQADSDFDYNINGYKRKKKPVTTRKSSRKPKDSDTVKKSRSSSGASSSSRNNRNRKSSSRSSKTSKPDGTRIDPEPPSFASVQGDLFTDSNADKFGAYRSF
jgi:hypothetical protein